MAKCGSRRELEGRGNGAEGLAHPVAKFCFFVFFGWGAEHVNDTAFGLLLCKRMTEQNVHL